MEKPAVFCDFLTTRLIHLPHEPAGVALGNNANLRQESSWITDLV
jgi:hypothetical protein